MNHYNLELEPSSTSNFFWNERSIDEVRFVRDKKNKVTGYIVFSGEKEEVKKVSDLPKSK